MREGEGGRGADKGTSTGGGEEEVVICAATRKKQKLVLIFEKIRSNLKI